jgi:transcriptional regulator with XRE-family HTH domain
MDANGIYMRERLEPFGLRVRELREKRKLTQEELADLSGLNRPYLTLVESGKENISVVNLLAIANALGVTPAELFSGYTPAAMRKLFRE